MLVISENKVTASILLANAFEAVSSRAYLYIDDIAMEDIEGIEELKG